MPIDVFNLVPGRETSKSSHEVGCACDDQVMQSFATYYLLESGIISRSEFPVSSALHLVPKGQPGNFRLVADYRKLNQQTVPDRYPTPSVTHLLHRLQGSCIFSKVDLVRAYHQIPVAKESRHKTAMTTPIGLFEYNFLPFGHWFT